MHHGTKHQCLGGGCVFCLVALEYVIVQFGWLPDRQSVVSQLVGPRPFPCAMRTCRLAWTAYHPDAFSCRAGRRLPLLHPRLHLCMRRRALSLQERRPSQRPACTFRQRMPRQDWALPRLRWAQARVLRIVVASCPLASHVFWWPAAATTLVQLNFDAPCTCGAASKAG